MTTMGELTLEEYRNSLSPEKDLNKFLRQEAEKFFRANFSNHKGFKEPTSRLGKIVGILDGREEIPDSF